MSLASTLLDRRIPEMMLGEMKHKTPPIVTVFIKFAGTIGRPRTIKVYRVRRICQDALVSVARLPISTTELAGTSREHTISLANGCGMITVRCSFNCSVNDLPNLQSVLAYPRRHSLAKFAQALAQLLQGEDGLEILQRAVPKALHLPTEKVTSTMQSFLVSLCNQVTWHTEDPGSLMHFFFLNITCAMKSYSSISDSSGTVLSSQHIVHSIASAKLHCLVCCSPTLMINPQSVVRGEHAFRR